MLEIIQNEIRRLFHSLVEEWQDSSYEVHCCQEVLDEVEKDFRKLGFQIPTNSFEVGERTLPPRWVTFQIPNIGRIKFIPDMTSGYRISKI